MMDDYQVVQVRIVGAPRAYAYVWRGEPLVLGDWVTLPGNVVSPDGCEGPVEGFGRDGYRGELKEVLARTAPQDPWTARMRAAKTRGEALLIYREARHKGLDPQRLAALVDAGRKAARRW